MASGPIQPMYNVAQANLRGMRDEILGWNPDYPPYLADTSINNKLREVLDRRMWSGLLVKDQLLIPASYTTGTVTVTRDSATVAGSATAWAVADKVNTTLSTAITSADLNVIVEVTLVALTNITAGDWVTVDAATGSEEQVLVIWVGTTTIKGVFTIAHATSTPITKSSLVRQQFRLNETSPWYTVTGVSSTTSLKLDQVFGGSTTAATGYSIFMGYVTFGQNAKMVYSVLNLSRRYRMKLHMPQEALNLYDPQRSATESTFLLADYIPDEIGRPRFELYPRPTSEQVFPYIVYRQTSSLFDDDDTPPPFVRSDVLVKGALADALRWRGRTSKYYDPTTATQKMVEFEKGVIEMAMADDSVYLTNLLWDFNRFPFGGYGADWYQSHDVGINNGDF